MSSGSALNLSLLSRGVGEVKRNGSEKVDVIFEPQDYFNFVEESHERPFFLPPIHTRYGFNDGSQVSSRYGPKDPVYLPKTFTTRKGALLLFSEDMASKTKKADAKKHKSVGFHSDHDHAVSTLAGSMDDRDLKTVDDLAKSILAYGSFDEGGQMNLKFLHPKRRYDFDRQIRPGFSAKRYLSTWTKTWDDTVLEKVISKGYLTEKSLFYYNPLLPHLSRRLNDDMSHYPTPYKLMRSMLMSPGSLSGYTFYRVRPESQESDYDMTTVAIEEDRGSTHPRTMHPRSVKVVSVKADGQEVLYGTLDPNAQKEVLTDLLVKSAVHYAMKTQKDFVEKIPEYMEGAELGNVPKFDMQDAVESMLHDHDPKGAQQQVLDANLPDVDDKSQHSGSFKGGKLGYNRQNPTIKERGHPPGHTEGLAGVPLRDYDAVSSGSSGALHSLPTGSPVLPPIGQTYTQLTTIGEASREHTQAFSLPVHDKDDEDNEAWAGQGVTEPDVTKKTQREAEEKKRKDSERRKPKISARSLDLEGPVITGGAHLMSSSESLGPGSTQSHSSGWQQTSHKQQWKGSTQSLRSHGSRKASGSLVDGDKRSNKGSVVFGPDGEMIKVGEAIKLSSRASEVVQDVQDANLYPGLRDASDDSDAEAPEEWKETRRPLSGRKSESLRRFGKRDSAKSQVTEQEIIDTLTTHATKIAESVLSASDGGQVLEDDIRTVIQEVMKAQKRNSAGPTVAEYRDQIKGNLMTALAKATGLDQSEIPADAEIDPLLMEQLANQELTPEDIEIVHDEETGRSYIRSRNRHIAEAMGGVQKGHLYQSGGKTGADGKRVSIPSERNPNADIGALDIIKYGGLEEEDKEAQKPPSEKVPSEVGSKKGSSIRGKSPTKSVVAGSLPGEGGDAKSSTGKSLVSFKEGQQGDDLTNIMADLDNRTSPHGKSDLVSLKSGVSRKNDDNKSKVSDGSVKKAPSPDKKEEFVVAAGTLDHTEENKKIYGMPPTLPASRKPKEKKAASKPPAKGKKGAKKGKGKVTKKTVEEPQAEPETAMQSQSPIKMPTPPPPKEQTPKPESPASERYETPPQLNSDDEEDFIIIRNETMSPEQEQDMRLNITTSPEEEPDEEQPLDEEGMSEADKQRMISNREARAAKRAAAADKRRLDVERKRKEREELLKKEKEEHERQDKLKLELEEQRKRKEEERRLKKQKEDEENDEAMREEVERQRREKADVEKEKRRKEEYAKKLEEMKRRQQEDEKRRAEEAELRRLEEEERRKEEEELMAKMAEEERAEYERKKREEEEERIRKAEEDKKRREMEAQRALEEARRLAEEMARKQAELEARLRFNRSLQMESNGLEHTQDITKAFVFSYFELLQWLGLDIPEFELLKLNQY